LRWLILLLLFFACKKEENSQDQFGCIYRINKVTQRREFIGCWHKEMRLTGGNQDAADKIAASLGITRVNVTILKNYSTTEFHLNPKCNCP
jgi:hypothetical protein